MLELSLSAVNTRMLELVLLSLGWQDDDNGT